MLSTLLMVVATFCLAIASLGLFDKGVGLEHPLGWLATGLTLWAVAVLVGGAAPVIERLRQ